MLTHVKHAFLVLVAVVGFSSLAAAQGGVTLPDLGVDVGGTAEAMGADLGPDFMTVLGSSAVFIAGGIAWKWLRRAR